MSPSRKKLLLPLAVVLLGFLCFRLLVWLGPEATPQPQERAPRLVRVVPVEIQTERLQVVTQGTVMPRTESDLVPEITGPVTWVASSLVSGGFFEEGAPLLRIDPRDYQVELAQARANLARAQSEHRRARKELERRESLAERNVASASQLDDALNDERVARATLDQAKAQLDRAERDLDRTEIRAPFKGRVRNEQVDVGQFVSRGQSIATLYAIDYAEVRLPVLDEDLGYLDLPLWHRNGHEPLEGPAVRLSARFAGADHTWEGNIVRTEGEIDPKSRMVHVVARVEDPYGEADRPGRPPLAVGLFVQAEILGREAQNVAILPRSALRDRNRIMLIDADNRLRFREVEVLRTARDTVVVSKGLVAGELVVTSPLDTPVEGMRVRPVLPGGAAQTGEDA